MKHNLLAPIYIYIYIYMCHETQFTDIYLCIYLCAKIMFRGIYICVCVCVRARVRARKLSFLAHDLCASKINFLHIYHVSENQFY